MISDENNEGKNSTTTAKNSLLGRVLTYGKERMALEIGVPSD